MEVQSFLNEDTGKEKLRITHDLTANVMKTDKVMFEIAYEVSSLPTQTVGSLIQRDMVRCQMEINSNDNRFWVATLTDGYYTKDVVDALSGSPQEPQSELAENTSWATPFADNSEKEADRWCTAANSKTIWSEYQCTRLRCYLERDMNTGDSNYDLNFTVKSGTIDKMVIPIQGAQLWFNKTSFSTSAKAPNLAALEVTVYSGANMLNNVSMLFASAIGAYLLF